MTQRSTVLLILDVCAMTAIPVLAIDAALLSWSGRSLMTMVALGLLGPLLIIEALSIAIFLVRMMASPAARAVFKADLSEPGISWETGEEDRRVRFVRTFMLGSGAFTAACLAWFLGVDMPRPVAEVSAQAATIGLILFWASANSWCLLGFHVAAMREARLSEIVVGGWSHDGRSLVLDSAKLGAVR